MAHVIEKYQNQLETRQPRCQLKAFWTEHQFVRPRPNPRSSIVSSRARAKGWYCTGKVFQQGPFSQQVRFGPEDNLFETLLTTSYSKNTSQH